MTHTHGLTYLLVFNVHGRKEYRLPSLFGLGTHTLTVYFVHALNNILNHAGTHVSIMTSLRRHFNMALLYYQICSTLSIMATCIDDQVIV